MKIINYDELDSTQLEAKRLLDQDFLQPCLSKPFVPFCLVAKRQTAGIGSRSNHWSSQEGNAFFSFVLELRQLPKDLPLQSAAIYFGFLLKIVLAARNSQAFLKWPNDIYIQSDKIGGIISQQYSNYLICGVGLNLKNNHHFKGLDIHLTVQDLLDDYLIILSLGKTWRNILADFKKEFYKCHEFDFHHNGRLLKLALTTLNIDGSLHFAGQNIYALR